jgi:hypothetical protein
LAKQVANLKGLSKDATTAQNQILESEAAIFEMSNFTIDGIVAKVEGLSDPDGNPISPTEITRLKTGYLSRINIYRLPTSFLGSMRLRDSATSVDLASTKVFDFDFFHITKHTASH